MRWAITACVRAAARGVQQRSGLQLAQDRSLHLAQSRSLQLAQIRSLQLAQYSSTTETETETETQTNTQPDAQAGRHRRRTKTMRAGSSKELIWRRQLAQLEQTWQADLGDLGPGPSADDAQHFLVRKLSSTLRRLGSLGTDPAADDSEAAVVEAAWMQYGKIRHHAQASSLLHTMPSALLGLLVCALNFARAPAGSGDVAVRYTRIVRVFADLRETGKTVDHPVVFAAYLRALNKLGNSSRALQEAAEYERRQTEADGAYGAPSSVERQVIRACFGVRRSDLALARLQQLPKDRMTAHVHAVVVSGLIAGGASDRLVLEHVAGLLDELARASYTPASRTGAMNEVLHAAGRQTRAALLLAIYERFNARQTPPNPATLGIILHCAVRQEPDARQLRRVFAELSDPGSSVYGALSAQVFGMFIDAFVRTGRADYACEALDALRRHPSARMGARHVCGLLAFYAEHAVGVQALGVFRQAAGDGVALPWAACEHTALALARSGACEEDVESAEDVLAVRLVRLVSKGYIARAADVFAKLVHEHPASAPLAFACLLLANHTADKHHAALKHALHLAPPATSPVSWPSGLFDAVLGILAQQRDREGVEHVYALMVDQGYDPSARTFNALLLAFARGNDVDVAHQVLEEMTSDGMHVRAPVVSALVHMLLRQASVDQALSAYATVVGRTLPLRPGVRLSVGMAGSVDFYALAMLVRALALARRSVEAAEVFEDAFALLECVPRRLLETLVAALEDAGMHEEAQQCLRRFARRVEECQPPPEDSAVDAAAERLPLSHFAYALGGEPDPSE
ncbi:hypothetical protein LPJ53_004352 [Coemansia erecta]|uniref:PROP1-like PPR domain-containing protein n=1 Tax=Coemansia erecta TaxID=147472 RepID=A0A9W7XYP3_9FUNG|nr:hypothetical protein LPJ53_004352 [Coemansia erecta]